MRPLDAAARGSCGGVPIYLRLATAATATIALTARSAAAISLGKASQTATTAAMYSSTKITRAVGNSRPYIFGESPNGREQCQLTLP
jgi:hypothetical protein